MTQGHDFANNLDSLSYMANNRQRSNSVESGTLQREEASGGSQEISSSSATQMPPPHLLPSVDEFPSVPHQQHVKVVDTDVRVDLNGSGSGGVLGGDGFGAAAVEGGGEGTPFQEEPQHCPEDDDMAARLARLKVA